MKGTYRMIMRGVAGAALVAGMAGSAVAQDEEGERRGPPRDGGPGGGPRGVMAALDLNRDGKLDQHEIDMAVVSLRKLDRNKDGELTPDELFGGGRPPGDRPGGGPDAGRRPGFAQLDRDGDGKISKDEAPPRLQERFEEVDTNGDGFLDKAEQEALLEIMRQRFRQGGGARPGQGRPQRDRGAGEGGADRPRRPDPSPDQ